MYNEQAALEQSIRRLHRFLSDEFPFSWRIVIADNASTDATPQIARALADGLPGVTALRLERKGRGLALREAWSASDATVVSYMDVDLSTDLRALLPLVAPLLSGHSDLAIGTRLAPSARVVRGPRRELISRSYNRLLHTAANRRLTFGVRGRTGLARQHALGAVVFVLTLGLTSGALAILRAFDARPPRALELAVLILAGTAATVTRYVALKTWVFAGRRRVTPVAAGQPAA